MTRIERLRALINNGLEPAYLEILNESGQHSRGGAETHLRVIVVADRFDGQSPVQRQRLVNLLVADEFNQGLHALALRTLTPAEWEAQGGRDSQSSPLCHGRRGGGL